MPSLEETAIGQVLAAEVVWLRARYPGLFLVVDAILATADRPSAESRQRFKNALATDEARYRAWRRECGWCGDFFFVPPTAVSATCGLAECRYAFQKWKRRRRS